MNTNVFSRRSFLRTTARVAGASVVAGIRLLEPEPWVAAAQLTGPNDRIRFGIVGVGMEGSSLLATAIQLPGLERMFTLKSTEEYWDKHFRLSNFAALGKFSLRDYRGREMGKRFGDAYIEGVEQGLGRGGRRGDAETGSLSFYLQFHCAQHLELSEPFFDG